MEDIQRMNEIIQRAWDERDLAVQTVADLEKKNRSPKRRKCPHEERNRWAVPPAGYDPNRRRCQDLPQQKRKQKILHNFVNKEV